MINSTTKLSLKLLASWLMLLCVFIFLGSLIFGSQENINLYSLANWDGRHYLEIAQSGYKNKIQYAFFPLYPVLINLVSNISGLTFLYAAFLINLLSVFGLIYLFLTYLKQNNFNNPVKTLTNFLIFPTSFYLICTYSESLFLFFALSTFCLISKKKFYLAAVFASLSVSVRIAGLAVIAGLLTEIFLTKTSLKDKILLSLISFSGLIIYCAYLYSQTGNPLYFLVSELSWDRGVTIPGQNILAIVQYIVYFGLRPESFTLLSDLFFTIFGLGIAFRSFKNLKPSLSAFTSIALLLPLVTSLLLSIPRFLIAVFPLFILITKIKNRVFNISYIIISLTLLFLYFNFFIRNIWIS